MVIIAGMAPVYGQIDLGIRVGANASRSIFDDKVYKSFNNSHYKPGYLAGIVAVFNNENDKYALQTELYYSRIGRKIESEGNTFQENIAAYNYIHLPVMFRMRFKLGYFDWYALLGPQISYWFGGKGEYRVFDNSRQNVFVYDYKINFDEPVQEFGYLNVTDHNSIQLGLSLGVGVLYELNETDRAIIDLRYYFGHSYMGEEEGGEIPNSGIFENFQSTNQSIELSLIYSFDIYNKIKYMRNQYR